ncbi:integrin alpha-V [Centropristis striata]|uniref:integrin alpha-V n=1 Tax=Centropristis striata TaxID=184440 RepID=UPI0027DF9FC8|nr:integrin alpha-V [Centropristis striata]
MTGPRTGARAALLPLLPLLLLLLLLCSCFRRGASFNLDVDKPSVFSGPDGSYFGFSVDFFKPLDNQKSEVLVGAPRANFSSLDSVVERGAVFSCPWKTSACQPLQFDTSDNRDKDGAQMEFKSKQWFGASVRSDGEHILACAPLYQWSTFGVSEREPVGTCFLKKGAKVVEYSPCRSGATSPEGQGFCQAGFSADFLKKNNRVVVGGPGSFYWQGQLISDDVSEILTRSSEEYTNPYENTLATKSASAQYDDSYLGYSVTVGDFNDDGKEDYVTGVPRGDKALGYVNIFNGQNMESVVNYTGTQMAAYFGHSVAATDVNNDGLVDLLVGAPLFMDRWSDGKLREVGQVSVYLGRGGFSFHSPPQLLTGSEVYARYGSAIAALGDLDMDGYNDVAISAPYGGADGHGLVYIHNGRPRGPDSAPSQVLQGKWASSYMPASFGYSMTGNTDIDQNGYPDLIVGVFGADKAVLYRARPVLSVNATLDLTPQIINSEDKTCTLPGTTTQVSCFMVKYCLKASGRGAPAKLNFKVDLTLDRLKQKDLTKRVLFLFNRAYQYSKTMEVSTGGRATCEEQMVFLDDRGFRDKITPISVAMEYSLDYQRAADPTGLLPIIDVSAPSNVTKQAHILLDCGEDNICKPDLRLSVKSDRQQMYTGDDNALTLEVIAENQGEGAYEADLHIYLPPQADFTGVVKGQTRLSCGNRKENQTKIVVCDLGNPMKGGTKVLAELRFSVLQLSEDDTSVRFDLQIVSSNQFNNKSPQVSSIIQLAVLAKVSIRGTSSPATILLPIANWKPRDPPVVGDDIGPQIVHVYELHNSGPSTISKASLVVKWPYRLKNGSLLYITSFDTEGPINCSTEVEINPLNVSNPLMTQDINATGGVPTRERETEGRNRKLVREKRDLENKDTQNDILDCTTAQCLDVKCQVGRLERTKQAILFIYSRLAVNNFLRTENQNRSYVVRSTATFNVIEVPYKNLEADLPSNSTTVNVSVTWLAEASQPVPGWVVALAVLAGLLLLALLIFIMYKLGFFKRVRPPQEDCTEKEQLQPEENGNTDA